MKHYVILMEEKRILKGTYSTLAYIKSAFGNEIPIFRRSVPTLVNTIKAVEEEGFKSISPLTVEEVILHEIGCITIFFFNAESVFTHSLVYNLG